MARNFNAGAVDKILLGMGNTSGVTAPFTWMALFKKASNGASMAMISLANSGGGNRNAYRFNTADQMQLALSTGNLTGTAATAVLAADGWCMGFASKDTGTVAARLSRYLYTANTWAHENTVGTAGNPNSITDGSIRIGVHDDTAAPFDGEIALAVMWNRILSDAEREMMAYSLQSVIASNPVGGWLLDQAATGQAVVDITGGKADQTSISGTAVSTSSVPGFGYGIGVIPVGAIVVSASGHKNRLLLGVG